MKKMFFYAALASVAFASCTKEQGIELPNNGESEAAARIEFKMHNNINVATRSTGAVGDTIGSAKNVWNNQELNVFMFKQNTLTLAQEEFSVGEYVTKRAIFDNAKVVAPAGRDSVSADYGYEAKYYPATGAYDFFAYYDDDAAIGEPSNTTLAAGDTIKRLPISINGAQDLMVAKAIPSATDKAKYLNDANAAQNDPDCKRFYSAYTARRGVQPVLTFEHLLTRFVFYVSSDSAKYCDPTTGITIDSIAIRNVEYSGKMVVAYTADKPAKMITWDAPTTTLWLQQRYENNVAKKDTVQKLVAKNPMWNDPETDVVESQRIGESLLVPTYDSYELVIYYSQRPNAAETKPTGWEDSVDGSWEAYKNRVYSSVYEKTITPEDPDAGKQYNVYFNVFGLERIDIDVKLTGWELGKDVNIDNDEW